MKDTSNKNYFIGIMHGYEIEQQKSMILSRRKTESAHFEQLSEELENSKNNLINSVDTFKSEFTTWGTEARENWINWVKERDTEWSTINNVIKEESSEITNSIQKSFSAFIDNCNYNISDLEKTFEEKLRLEKPAEYWKKASRRYGVQGGLWCLALLSLGLLGIMYFREFFNSWAAGNELDIKLNNIQGIAIFGTILAVYAFLLRIASRLTFSCFHLMRDAEEREQLTYLYLSLSKEHTVDETSRSIILQALFSRSETGLLSSESGPTMPGIHEVIRAANPK